MIAADPGPLAQGRVPAQGQGLKILASHPIQYQAPLFRELVRGGIDLEVGFYHPGTARQPGRDHEFGIDIRWDVDLLSGYRHRTFLPRLAGYTLAEQVGTAPALLPWALADRHTPLLLSGWFAELIWLVWLIRVISGAPTLVICETTPLSFGATAKPWWRTQLLKLLLRRTHACLVIGARNHAFLESMGVHRDRMFAAPYSIDNARFAAEAARLQAERRELCCQHGLDPDLPTFVYCGKLIAKKRPLELLQAYLDAGLKERAQLVYVGDGALRAVLEARIREAGATSVRLLGFLNQRAMPQAYVIGDVLCLISDPTETWGLVANEALACGRPVIVADTVGCGPDLVHPDNGWVVPLADPAALVATLREAYQRRQEWAAMGRRGQARVAAHSFTAMAGGVHAALGSLHLARK